MGEYRFTVRVAAPPEQVFDLWVNVDRAPEWIGGLTEVTDRVGEPGTTGASYVSHFGRMRSPTVVLEAERPRRIRTRFGSWLLKGENAATFEADGDGTRLDQTYRTTGAISAIAARIFASGSYKGSFQGELEHFARIAEAEAQARAEAPAHEAPAHEAPAHVSPDRSPSA
jgi:uncharacterized protein YndB with AHSA1/START domain